MRIVQYKIVEFEKEKYKIYRRCLFFFWKALTDEDNEYEQLNEVVYTSWHSASTALVAYARTHGKSKFKQQKYFFNNDGQQVD